jgi:imidazolonepropionase-like amidohydrolase
MACGGNRPTEWFFTNSRIVDVDAGLTTSRQTIHVVDGTVADTDAGSPPAAADIVDLRGRYVLPGLINCHTHLQGQYPYSRRSAGELPSVTALRAAHQATRTLHAGITTVRCVHEQSRADLAVRSADAAGWVAAPGILGAGRALTVAGGHGDGLGCVVASGRTGFRDAASTELAAGADHVKIFLTGGLARGAESIDDLQMTSAEIAGAVEAAKASGTYVVAHAGGAQAIQAGLVAGVRSFEHGYRLNPAIAAQLAAAGAFLTPTLVVTHAEDWMTRLGFDQQAIDRTEAIRQEHEHSVRLAITAGIHLVSGTDFPPADDWGGNCPMLVREVELLHAAGLTPLESLRSATVTAADLLRLTGKIGSIAPGARADMIAVPNDPLDSPSALRQIQVVIKSGDVIRYDP